MDKENITILDWNNYLELNDYIKEQSFIREPLTTLQLITWKYYGFIIKFHKVGKCLLLYICNENNKDDLIPQWKVFTSYYQSDFDLKYIKQIIKEDLVFLNNKEDLFFSEISFAMINDFKIDDKNNTCVPSSYVSNYIYELEKMRSFGGKKLQKKRNHLNSFINQNYNIVIKDLKDVDMKDIFNFLDSHMLKYDESRRQYEIDIYKQFLLFEYQRDKRYLGTVVYIDNKIVAFTFCFKHQDKLQIIIEKAERDIRGLYQFIIKTNIEFHNINLEYMDREDDAGIESLTISKKSYYPIEMVKRYSIDNVKNWY